MGTKTNDDAARWTGGDFLLHSIVCAMAIAALAVAAWPFLDSRGWRPGVALASVFVIVTASYNVGRFIGVNELRKSRGETSLLD